MKFYGKPSLPGFYRGLLACLDSIQNSIYLPEVTQHKHSSNLQIKKKLRRKFA